MRRRMLVLGGAIFLAIGGTIGEEIIASFGPGLRSRGKNEFCRRRDADLRRAMFQLPSARWTGRSKDWT